LQQHFRWQLTRINVAMLGCITGFREGVHDITQVTWYKEQSFLVSW
jgi:hypothetical protein